MGVQERREREKLARQEAILEAAQEVFFTKGLEQATIDDIAKAAELSKGTIYLYFKSKEELYISVFLKGLNILFHQLQVVTHHVETKRADELIKDVGDIYYAFFMKYPEHFYILSLFHHGRIKDKINPELWGRTHEKTQDCLMVFSETIQKGITDGIFQDVDSWKAANSLWGSATGVMMMLNDEEHQKFINIPVKELLDYTIDMLIESLRKPQ